jgi:hypothetical protein
MTGGHWSEKRPNTCDASRVKGEERRVNGEKTGIMYEFRNLGIIKAVKRERASVYEFLNTSIP